MAASQPKAKSKGKGNRIGGDGPRLSKSKHAGLVMPVLQFHRSLKKNIRLKQVRILASVYMTAVIEYLCAEVLEVSGEVTRNSKKHRIIPRHIYLAANQDQELNNLLKHVVIPSTGVMPFIHQVLLKKKTQPQNQI